MNLLRHGLCAAVWMVGAVLALGAAPVRYEVWTDPTNPSKTFRGHVTAVHGPMVFFETKSGLAAWATLDRLPPAEAVRVADFLAANPERQRAPWVTSPAPIASALRGHLQILCDGRLIDFDPGSRAEPLFYLVYFSAGWCGPCHRFTPLLTAAYQKLRAAGVDDFEVVFISSDESGTDMAAYMQQMKMPWPAVAWNKRDHVHPLTAHAGNGIPCLVVLDRDGNLLFHSYAGTEYLGADDPLERFTRLDALRQPGNVQAAGARFRFERSVHLERNKVAGAPPKPYHLGLDPTRFREEGATRFNVALTIAESGAVINARVLDPIPLGLADLVESEARTWLFLPRVQDGEYRRAEVVLPFNLDPPGSSAP
jgi:thiol-disulfide isomerase/thioredoxin